MRAKFNSKRTSKKFGARRRRNTLQYDILRHSSVLSAFRSKMQRTISVPCGQSRSTHLRLLLQGLLLLQWLQRLLYRSHLLRLMFLLPWRCRRRQCLCNRNRYSTRNPTGHLTLLQQRKQQVTQTHLLGSAVSRRRSLLCPLLHALSKATLTESTRSSKLKETSLYCVGSSEQKFRPFSGKLIRRYQRQC